MNIAQPLVTIGISTYNRSESLHQYSLSAIEKLTYPNYEVIVVDDCSTDKTQQILCQYKDKLKKIRIFRNDKNRGLPYSRNQILKNAKGNIIVFTDDDVSLFPNCLDEIIKIYTQYPEVAFIWGCVYQCHGSHDRNEPTFGSGSLFSIKGTVVNCFRFDTNIQYFKTYGCEEHDFARRVQRAQLKIIKAETVKANHYQAPAKDRAWRGLGGDLNHLYEITKRNSIWMYYKCLILGIPYTFQRFTAKNDFEEKFHQYPYKEAIHAFYRVLVFIKEGKLEIAGKYLFYTIVDIPIRAKIRGTMETKQARKFAQYPRSN